MHSTVRARVKAGILELLENIDLPEGAEVIVTIMALNVFDHCSPSLP